MRSGRELKHLADGRNGRERADGHVVQITRLESAQRLRRTQPRRTDRDQAFHPGSLARHQQVGARHQAAVAVPYQIDAIRVRMHLQRQPDVFLQRFRSLLVVQAPVVREHEQVRGRGLPQPRPSAQPQPLLHLRSRGRQPAALELVFHKPHLAREMVDPVPINRGRLGRNLQREPKHVRGERLAGRRAVRLDPQILPRTIQHGNHRIGSEDRTGTGGQFARGLRESQPMVHAVDLQLRRGKTRHQHHRPLGVVHPQQPVRPRHQHGLPIALQHLAHHRHLGNQGDDQRHLFPQVEGAQRIRRQMIDSRHLFDRLARLRDLHPEQRDCRVQPQFTHEGRQPARRRLEWIRKAQQRFGPFARQSHPQPRRRPQVHARDFPRGRLLVQRRQLLHRGRSAQYDERSRQEPVVERVIRIIRQPTRHELVRQQLQREPEALELRRQLLRALRQLEHRLCAIHHARRLRHAGQRLLHAERSHHEVDRPLRQQRTVQLLIPHHRRHRRPSTLHLWHPARVHRRQHQRQAPAPVRRTARRVHHHVIVPRRIHRRRVCSVPRLQDIRHRHRRCRPQETCRRCRILRRQLLGIEQRVEPDKREPGSRLHIAPIRSAKGQVDARWIRHVIPHPRPRPINAPDQRRRDTAHHRKQQLHRIIEQRAATRRHRQQSIRAPLHRTRGAFSGRKVKPLDQHRSRRRRQIDHSQGSVPATTDRHQCEVPTHEVGPVVHRRCRQQKDPTQEVPLGKRDESVRQWVRIRRCQHGREPRRIRSGQEPAHGHHQSRSRVEIKVVVPLRGLLGRKRERHPWRRQRTPVRRWHHIARITEISVAVGVRPIRGVSEAIQASAPLFHPAEGVEVDQLHARDIRPQLEVAEVRRIPLRLHDLGKGLRLGHPLGHRRAAILIRCATAQDQTSSQRDLASFNAPELKVLGFVRVPGEHREQVLAHAGPIGGTRRRQRVSRNQRHGCRIPGPDVPDALGFVRRAKVPHAQSSLGSLALQGVPKAAQQGRARAGVAFEQFHHRTGLDESHRERLLLRLLGILIEGLAALTRDSRPHRKPHRARGRPIVMDRELAPLRIHLHPTHEMSTGECQPVIRASSQQRLRQRTVEPDPDRRQCRQVRRPIRRPRKDHAQGHVVLRIGRHHRRSADAERDRVRRDVRLARGIHHRCLQHHATWHRQFQSVAPDLPRRFVRHQFTRRQRVRRVDKLAPQVLHPLHHDRRRPHLTVVHPYDEQVHPIPRTGSRPRQVRRVAHAHPRRGDVLHRAQFRRQFTEHQLGIHHGRPLPLARECPGPRPLERKPRMGRHQCPRGC